MDDTSPLLIASAPNGATKTRAQHKQLPITAEQIADTAFDVHQAGARMLHLHVRDGDGKHTLNAAAYQAAVTAVREKVGDEMFIQLTSEAAGVYNAEQQHSALYDIAELDGVDGVSIALRELIRDGDGAAFEKLCQHLTARGIIMQYILYSADDVKRYTTLKQSGAIPAARHSVLLVVGKDAAQSSDVLGKMVEILRVGDDVEWMVCAFGTGEFECLTQAIALGGHVRVGFENSLTLRDGTPARDNRELVTQIAQVSNPTRHLADINQARKILGAL